MRLLRRDVCCEQAASGLVQWDTSLLMRKETKKCPISTSSVCWLYVPHRKPSSQQHRRLTTGNSPIPRQRILCRPCRALHAVARNSWTSIPTDTSVPLNNKDQLQGSCCLAVLQPAQATSKKSERNCAKQNRMTWSDDWSIFYLVDEQRKPTSPLWKLGRDYPGFMATKTQPA